MADLDYIEKHAMPHVIMTGNPVDGFALCGVFQNHQAAMAWAEKEKWEFDWWALPINPPYWGVPKPA